MAEEWRYPKGDQIVLTVPGASIGDAVASGWITGVALTDAEIDGRVTVKRCGSHILAVTAVDDDGNSAIAEGDCLFYQGLGLPLSKVKDGKVPFGWALEALNAGETGEIEVLLAGGEDCGLAEAGLIGTDQLEDGAVTTDKIANGAVTAAKFADGAGVAALIAAGLGGSEVCTKASDGVIDLLPAGTGVNAVLIIAICTETFANNTGTQTVFTVGDETTANKFMASTVLAGATVGDIFVAAGATASAEKVQITATKAVGDGTGAATFVALALPEAV